MIGIIKSEKINLNTTEETLYPVDLYRFVRKFYKGVWLYLTFLQRIFYLNNPIREIYGLWYTRRVEKVNLFREPYFYKNYSNYKSPIISSNPMVSIIIPTLNRYEVLNNLLQDLEKQIYTNFEVILIDQSKPFQKDLYNNFNLRYHIIRQKEPALWKARNRGIKYAKSEYLLFLDDDSRIASDWITEHLKCIDYFQADISSGVSKSLIGAKIPENYSFFRWSDQLDTGNVLIKRNVFEVCGLFDRQFEKMRMGDGEFGVRAYLSGFKNISNPKASREHLKMSKGGLRNFGHWDAFRSKNIVAAKPVPSVLYFWRKYWGDESTIAALIQTIPFSLSPYSLKGKKIGYILSFTLLLLLLPFVLVQVVSSWYLATRMLKSSDRISRI